MTMPGESVAPGGGPHHESEESFRLLFFRNPLPMWVIEPRTTRFLEVNDMAVRTYGYSRDEFLAMTSMQIRDPGERERYLEFVAEGGQDREGDMGIWRHQRKDGRRISVHVRGHNLVFQGRPARLIIAEDVTERIAAESAAAQLSAIVESSNDAIVSRDRDGRIVSWNPGAERLFGFTAAEALGKGPELLNPPEGDPNHRGRFARALEGDAFNTNDTIRVAKDGRRIELDVSVFPIRGEDGEVDAVGIISRDMTAQRRAELASAQLAAIVGSSNDAVVSRDLDGVVISWNPAAERIYGYTAEEAIGQGPEFLAPPGRLDEIKRRLSEAASGGPATTYEAVRRTKDGREIILSMSLFPVRSEHGDVVAVAAISRDITAERATQREMAHLAALVSSSDDAIVSVDLNRNYITWNEGAERLFGYTADEALGQRAALIYPPEREAERDWIRATLDAGQAIESMESIRLRKDGSRVEVSTSYFPIRAADGEVIGFANVSRDITGRKNAERELRESYERYELATRATNDAIWDWDLNTDALLWTPQFSALFGYRPDEIVPTIGFWEDMIDPAERDRVVGSIRDAVAGEGEYWRAEYPLRRADGTYARVADRGFISRDESGRAVRMIGAIADITERTLAAEALEDSEARFRAVSEAVAAGLWAWDSDGIFFVNEAMSRILGYSREKLLEPDFMPALLFEEDRLLVRAHVEAWAKHDPEAPTVLEHRFIRADGEVRWLRLTATPVNIRGREGTLAAAFDITEERHAQEAIAMSEARFRSVIETVSAGVWIWNGTAITFVNQALCDITGYSADELTAPNFFDRLLHVDDRRAIFERGLARLRGESVADRYEARIHTKSGEIRHIDISATSIQFDGAPASLVTVFDVTDNRRMQEALRESEARFRAVLATVATGIWIWDGTSMSYVNDALVRITGYPREQIMDGHTFDSAIVHPDDREMIQARGNARIRGEDVPTVYELRVVRPGGEVRYLEITATLIDLGGRTVSLASAVDLTDRRLAEEERRRFDQQVQHAQKLESLGILAGGIAHDFNNLLVGVLGNAGLALMELPPDSPARRTITDIETAAKRAADLTRQMLAYSGKGQFVVETVDLSNVVREMAALLEVSISKRVALRYDFPPGLPGIEADSTQLRQVIMNLITNASDAIGDRDGLITIRTGTLFADRAYLAETYLDNELPEGTYVSLEVSDTGSGMDAETKGRIFDPFFSTKFTGRGLGLAAVLGIIRGHRGAIKVYSEPGRGTTFRVLFPPADFASPAPIAPTEGARAWGGGGTILVVDDDQSVRSVTARMLELAGFTTVAAEDGNRALELFDLHRDSIALVLLDLTMPGMDGEETFRALRLRRPDVRVVLTSGYSEQDATNRFVGKGLAGFLQKPFRHQDLIDKLREVLEG